MNPYILLVLVIGIVLGVVFGRRNSNVQSKQSLDKPNDFAQGKAENLEKILVYLGAHGGKASNDDIEKLLGVSDATVTRYFQELEEQGRVRQIGAEGKYVYYELVG